MDLSDCVDDAYTTIKVGRGGEFYDVKGMDALNQIGKYYICQDRRYLATLKQFSPEIYWHGRKRELPSFLMVNNLDDLKRTVHFELTWNDDVSMALKNNVGQVINLEFNIFDSMDE